MKTFCFPFLLPQFETDELCTLDKDKSHFCIHVLDYIQNFYVGQ